MLPQLRQLEQQNHNELVVIGVHAGKFWAERATENIRQAVLRFDIEHPVINDRFFRVWRSYAVSAWPTVVLVDPEGYVVDTHPGEIDAERYQPILNDLIEAFDKQGKLNRQPIHFEIEAAGEPARPLSFPGKVLVDGDRLFIADTDHHRIIRIALSADGVSGSVEAVIGRGQADFADGDFASVAFNRPQGMAIQGDTLYVADTDNHAIRAVDLDGKQVSTLAGTGDQARRANITGFAPRVALSSPWDVALHGRGLYIAMAGTHQIWRMDLATNDILPYAGTGAEAIGDGPRTEAALAQPSALATADNSMYFADSESSAVRVVDLPPDSEVSTVVGTGLFDFGDMDGIADEVRLQHPLGVTWHDGVVYIADTYNNKIKSLDPQTRQATTFAGTGEAGLRDGLDPLFYEPGGLQAANGRLYIADTNNHAIRVLDLSNKETATLQIDGLEPI